MDSVIESSESDIFQAIDSSLFAALQNLDIDKLTDKDIAHVLPYLAKLLLSSSFIGKQQLLSLLYPMRKMDDIIELLQARNIELNDLAQIEKSSSFESSDSSTRLKIVASEYLRVQDLARQQAFLANQTPKLIPSHLFDNTIYISDVAYCLSVLLLKNGTNLVINISDMCEALLHVKYGSTYVLRIVANMPDRCQEICQTLINYGERQDEGANFCEVSEMRAKTLKLLCMMNPSMAFTIRSITLQLRKMPSLTVMITVNQLRNALERYNHLVEQFSNDVNSTEQMEVDNSDGAEKTLEALGDTYDSAIAFVTGILLGVDEDTRVWFAQYTKTAQVKRIDHGHYTELAMFRSQTLICMNRLFPMLLDGECSVDFARSESTKDDDTSCNSWLKLDQKKLNRQLIRATATLRLFCALRGIGSLKLNSEESDVLLRLITSRPKVNQTSVNFATTGVCTILACSTLINSQKDERRAAEWLKWLTKESNYSDNRYSSHGKCSISELLLLIAIHFQSNQTHQIVDLVCATLNMKLQIKASVAKCRNLFVQEVFNDQMMAEHAVRVPVTKNLNDNITEFLPVHCIHQLLESRSFSKHQVQIKDWIYKQICESKKPIHHVLPKLIEAYVNSVILPANAQGGHWGDCSYNQPIPEEDIARIFETKLYSNTKSDHIKNQENGTKEVTKCDRKKTKKSDRRAINEDSQDTRDPKENSAQIVDVEAAQVLLLYYLVLYEDIRLKKNADLSAAERSRLIKYDHDFMMEIPVFYLIRMVRDKQSSFGHILPDLLKLVTSQYPQLCSIQHWLAIDHNQLGISADTDSQLGVIDGKLGSSTLKLLNLSNASTSSGFNQFNRESITKELLEGFKTIEAEPLALAKSISQIMSYPKEEIWPFVDIFIENLPKIISLEASNCSVYDKLICLSTKLWWKFNTVFPRKLWVMTVNALKKPQNVKIGVEVKPVEFTWDELALDPLIVLRCDNRIFRCVDTLNIVLHVLNAFLAASRRCLQDQINEQPSRQKDLRNIEELKTTLILAQTSAAIQILLESCIPTDEEQEALNRRESNEILTQNDELILKKFDASVNCICEHLHQVFIADINLAKLVHFQTYPSELLATTSDKIPSMHICLDFIPELLSQPDLTKQVFVIELTSHLCEKYAITKSLNVAKLCFNVAYTLLQLLASERRALFFIPVLPALLRICKVFPILREDVEIILNQINQITMAHMASTSSRLSLGSAKPLEGVDKMSWRETKKLMSTLSLHDALYLCIQRCSIDLDNLKELNKKLGIFVDKKQQPLSIYNTIFAFGNHVTNPNGG